MSKIKLTKEQRRLRKKHTKARKTGRLLKCEGYSVELVAGNQGFRIFGYWSKTEAEWWRDMLAKALATIRKS